MTVLRTHRRLPAIATGTLIALLDTGFVITCATMLWLNGRTSVIDPPFPALVVTVLIGAFFVGIRRSVSLRRRDRTGTAAVAAERTTVALQLLILAAAVAAWQITDIYQLGWGAVLAAIAMIVANALLLMSDVTTGSSRAVSRQHHLHARRLASIETLHIAAALLGIIALVVTAPVHLWRSDILNGTILLTAAAIGIGAAAEAALRTRFADTETDGAHGAATEQGRP